MKIAVSCISCGEAVVKNVYAVGSDVISLSLFEQETFRCKCGVNNHIGDIDVLTDEDLGLVEGDY